MYRMFYAYRYEVRNEGRGRDLYPLTHFTTMPRNSLTSKHRRAIKVAQVRRMKDPIAAAGVEISKGLRKRCRDAEKLVTALRKQNLDLSKALTERDEIIDDLRQQVDGLESYMSGEPY